MGATSLDGVLYPVAIVPGHGARPVIAVADGPHGAGNTPVGVRQGEIYVRAGGPQSVAIRSPDDWNALLDRCLSHRADLLGRILRQPIAKPSRPKSETSELLLAAVDAAARDFAEQISQLALRVADSEQARILDCAQNFCALGYALLDEAGELIEAENPRGLNDRDPWRCTATPTTAGRRSCRSPFPSGRRR